MTRRSLNREMRKLGFVPEPHRSTRPTKPLARIYAKGTTRIGLFECGTSCRRANDLPIVNRTVFINNAPDAKLIATELVKRAESTLE